MKNNLLLLATVALIPLSSSIQADDEVGTSIGPQDRLADAGIHISGTFSQGYINSEDNNFIADSEDGTFDFREYGINGIWEVRDKLMMGAQIFAREYGTVGNDEPYLDWGYLDYRPADVFGIRLGKMKIPNGLYNEEREIDALRTEILLPSGVYMEFAREMVSSVVGLGLYGDIDMNQAGTLSYFGQYGERTPDEDDGDFARILGSSNITIEDYDMGDSYSSKLEWSTPVNGLTFATTYSEEDLVINGTQDVGMYLARLSGAPESTWAMSSFSLPIVVDIDTLESLVLSVEYTVGNLVLASEWTRVTHDSVSTSPGTPDQNVSGEFEGYYVKAGYRWNTLFESAIGFSTMEDIINDSTSHDASISLRFDITENLIVKLEEHYIDGTAGLFEIENPDGLEEDMTVFLAKTTLYF